MSTQDLKYSVKKPTALIGLMLSLAFILLVVGWTAVSPARAAAQFITGIVTNPGGGIPPVDTIVHLLNPDGDLFGNALVDDATGAFSLGPVPNGNYILVAKEFGVGTTTPSLPLPINMMGEAIDIGVMALTNPTLTGTVTEPDGSVPITATVHIYRSGHLVQQDTAVNGNITMGGLLSGTYSLQAFPLTDDPFWRSAREQITVTAGISQEIDLTLQPANVVGTVTDLNDIPVGEAIVHVLGKQSYTYHRDHSNPSGYFAIGDLVDDTYWLWVQPPWDAGGLAPSSILTFTVAGDLTEMGAIALRDAPKTVSGVVETNTTIPVENARVIANRLDHPGHQEALTAADGSYSLHLSGGLWALKVEETDHAAPTDWLYDQPPLFVHFDQDFQPETKNINFTVLTADATVTGIITLPDGAVPPFTVTVNIRNNEGHGRAALIDPADGSFQLPLPHGNYVLHIHPVDPGFAGPPPQQIYLAPQQVLDVGTLALLARDAVIQGRVEDAQGDGVAGVRVIGWTRDHLGAQTMSGPDGSYLLAVTAGDWQVRPQVPYSLPFVFDGLPLSLTIAAGETILGNDFALTAADNLVQGQLVNEASDPVLANGWAAAGSSAGLVNGAPVEGGSFSLYLPDGEFTIKLHLASGSEWLAGAPQPVQVSGGETVTLTFPVQPQNARLVGALWDPRQEIVPTGVNGVVLASNPFAWIGDVINPANGSYALDLSAGIWHLGYHVDPASGYVVLDHHAFVPLEAGQTAVKALPVAERDGLISGIVRKPNGLPLPGAVVAVDGTSPLLQQVTLRTITNELGEFRLAVPHGNYRLRAAHERPQDWLNPALNHIFVPPDGQLSGLELQFREADVVLSGDTAVDGDEIVAGTVHIWAYNSDGAATYTSTPLGQPYSLNLLSNSHWTIGAVVETNSAYYGVREMITMGSGNGRLDLLLNGPFPKPGPVVVTFNASAAQHLSLADGTEIFVPAGAMPVNGEVTLHITPIATLPHQHHARLYKYGYAFIATDESGTPITSNFNQPVIIRFKYQDAGLEQLGLRESTLKPAYYSTSTQSWTIPESYVIDSAGNIVTMQIDHFTDYSLLGGVSYELLLPFIAQ